MLKGLKRTKALNELNQLIQSKARLKGLAKTLALKRQNELRADLGMGHRADKQDQAANKTRLNIDGSVSKNEIYAQVADWLKQNLQGKTITTVDGKKVTFNRKYGIDHIAHDSRRSILASKAVAFVAEVFESGRFIQRESLSKARKDKFIAFHIYEKQVEIDGKKVLLQAKAGEKLDGTLHTLDTLFAYHQKVKAVLDRMNNKKGHFLLCIKSMDLKGELALDENNNTMFDNLQDEYATLTILQVLDENGNDITDEILGDDWDGNDKTADAPQTAYQLADKAVKPDFSILEASNNPIEVVNYVYKNAQKQYANNQPKAITVKSDGSVILLGWQGIKHALSKNANETIALATTCIEQLIENAVLVTQMANKPKGKTEQTAQNTSYVKQTLLYKSVLQEKNKNTEIGIIVKVLADGSRVYDYFTLNMKKAPNGISGETNQPAVNRSFEYSVANTQNKVNTQTTY